MSDAPQFSEALDYHQQGRPGKTEVRATKPTATQHDLALAYTPGVAEPCLRIRDYPEDVFSYTNRGNLVAVVSNGTAVLGLGDIGPLASKPVMEGKAVLFKRFADIDVFDLEIDAADPEDVMQFCRLLYPTVAGINLEDIKAPECFIIESTLREELPIPVFHDDQHGTAIIAGAALLNSLELTDRAIEDVYVVFSGAGAAGIASARFLVQLGAHRDNIVLVDSRGVIRSDRDDLPAHKAEFATERDSHTLADAMVGADVFIGVSQAGIVSPEMVQSMADKPIVFALANPDPEITYEDARQARPDAIVATGRSDYPNQVNNVLGFPFIFRGALDVRATSITDGMKAAAARALAALAHEAVPESVLKAYGLEHLSFGPDYLIPKPFDSRVLTTVAPAVAEAAMAEGVASLPLDDLDAYREELRGKFRATYGLLHGIALRARERPMRIVYPHGADARTVRAARRVRDEGIASPVILGPLHEIEAKAAEIEIELDDILVLDPWQSPEQADRYAHELFELRRRRGLTLEDARRSLSDPDYFAAMMAHSGDTDAVIGGLTTNYPATLRPALQILPLEEGRTIVSALYVVVVRGRAFVFADCAVNLLPTSEQLAEIALSAAESARSEFDMEPRVALLSYSNFGSAGGEEPARVRRAIEICRQAAPDLPLDGEMQADTAVLPELLDRRYPFNRLGGEANVLVFPNLTAASASYKLLDRIGGAEVVGPILTGLSKSVHVLQRDASVSDIVNLTAIAVLDAQRKAAAV
ncbi:MAG: NADP-dependent malic enzyme [Acidimicrobiia bacterium]